MSSTPPVPKRSSKRRIPVREALREKSQSEANEIPLRLPRDLQDDSRPSIYDAIPYPTKPSQVLLPSTIRKQQYGLGEENVFPRMFSPEPRPLSRASSSQGRKRDSLTERPQTGHAPTLTLKRSVAALRDMYEAQAEKSRPSTALSPPFRPSTVTSRPRTQSSSDGFSGPSAWDLHSKVSSDDLALLPSLKDIATRKFSLRRIPSSSSLENAKSFEASSPLPSLGISSSDPVLVADDCSAAPTSPNIIRLGRSSSPIATPKSTSSPNVVTLGSSSTPASGSSPQTIRKRKRDDVLTGPSFAERTGIANPYAMSPTRGASLASSSAGAPSPSDAIMIPSSPPRPASLDSRVESEDGSVSQGLPSQAPRSDGGSVAGTHADLQVALTSSPGPSIQYPVVRAPSSNPIMISIPKRPPRTLRDRNPFKWSSRLSTVPSEFSEGMSKTSSKNSSFVVEEHDLTGVHSDLTGAEPYHSTSAEAAGSQVRIVPMIEADQHEGEAGDYVSALPHTEHRLPTPMRSSSFLGTGSSSSNSRLNSLRNSVDHRLTSMKSFPNSWSGSRHNSMRSSHRPSSSSSVTSSFQLPAWAQRYYSGGYRDSFQYLYAGSTPQVDQINSRGYAPRTPTSKSQNSVYPTYSTRPDTSTSTRSVIERTKDILMPKTRPRLEARKSHLEPGVGPLVSHPVRPPTASLRPVSLGLDPSDPRAHWAGAEEEEAMRDFQARQGAYPQRNRGLAPSTWSRSPHLHRDDREEFRSSRWKAPSIDESRLPLFSKRNAQVGCFVFGFVFPIAWFVAACLPLPARPREDDLEKTDATEHFLEARRKRRIAVVEELTWENARWWRMLNRTMCAVGVVVVVMVILLAALGTTKKW